jgi:hypothetical protein
MNPLNLGINIEAVFLNAVFYYSLVAVILGVGYFISSCLGGFFSTGLGGCCGWT